MGDFKRLVAWQKAHAYMIAMHAASHVPLNA